MINAGSVFCNRDTLVYKFFNCSSSDGIDFGSILLKTSSKSARVESNSSLNFLSIFRGFDFFARMLDFGQIQLKKSRKLRPWETFFECGLKNFTDWENSSPDSN